MIYLLLALATAVIGSLPLLVARKPAAAAVTAVAATLVLWPFYYSSALTLVWPLWGAVGVMVIIMWCGAGVIDSMVEEAFSHAAWFAIAGVLILAGRGCSGCGAIRADDYAGLIGQVENRVWTQDVQPKDPKHIRLVPQEMANWLADKQLGEAPGAIGSQFQVSKEHMTLQMIRGELWYAAPLDFKDFGAWQSADVAPGYVLVHGEDPLKQVIVKTDERFAYTPGAYFSRNLERHLRYNGYLTKGLTDFSFEIDENGKAWWVVTVFTPTIAWWGEKVEGIAIVDPTSGAIEFHPLGQVPAWVDRAVPGSFVASYIKWRGEYAGGWWNSVWAEKNITEPGACTLVYGSNGEPLWVTDVTSSNQRDQSLVGLMYTDSRTGKSVLYHAVGGTEEAVLKAVDNKVSYRNLHGSSPVIYNIYGTMAAIVPLLGASHTYQGVAIVRIDNMQVALGDDQYAALREYQRMISQSGQQIAPELAHARKTLTGKVDRVAAEIKEKETLYYVHLSGVRKLFTGGSTLSPKLPLARPGDEVVIGFIDSGEDVEPMLAFDDLSLPLDKTPAQQAVEEKARERRENVEVEDPAALRQKVNELSDQEIKDLLKLREQQKKRQK